MTWRCPKCAEFGFAGWETAPTVGAYPLCPTCSTELQICAKLSKPQRRKHRVFARDGYKCVTCDQRQKLTVDHILPLSRGGTNRFENLQTLCYRCNQRKAAKIPAGMKPRKRRREERVKIAWGGDVLVPIFKRDPWRWPWEVSD